MRTPGRDHVVGHPRELVDAVDGERAAGEPHREPDVVDVATGDRAAVGPHDVVQHAEDAVEVQRSGARRDDGTAGAGAGRRPTARPAARRRRPRSATGRIVTLRSVVVGGRACRGPRRSRRSGSRRRRTRPSRASGTTCRAPCRRRRRSRGRRPMPCASQSCQSTSGRRVGKEDHFLDRVDAGEQHRHPVHADAEPTRRRHAVLERPQVVLVDGSRASSSPASLAACSSSKRSRCSTGSLSSE